jgi:hypothetical protein
MPSKKPIPAPVRDYLSKIGRKGGRATDPAKAVERARKAGLANAKKYGLGQFSYKPPTLKNP